MHMNSDKRRFFCALFVALLGCGGDGGAADDAGSDGPGDTSTGPDGMDCVAGCFISEVCYSDGAQRPGNTCQVCDPQASADDWTDADGDSCSDGLHCNGEDTCSGGACSVHTGDPCIDDGLFCNGAESCDDDADWCVSPGDPCDPTEACSEEDDACCEQGVGLGCDEDGNVVELDSCGQAGAFVATCPDLENGTCDRGFCGCTPGFTGEACDRCVVYVSGDDGDDGDDGATWSSAKATIQGGLDAAEAGSCEVWVAGSADPYLPTSGSGRNATVQLRSGVDLYGGFEGHEITVAQRDWDANKTTISGDLGVSGDASDDACHVVTGADAASIDGFVITAGRADAGCSLPEFGGGMVADSGALQVANCRFVANHTTGSGGALSIGGAVVTAAELVFKSNSADGAGGAVAVSTGQFVLTGGRFNSNVAGSHGGAITLGSGLLSVTGAVFSNNEAGGDGGAVYTEECGGGQISMINSVFHSNQASGLGGGAYLATYGLLVNNVVAVNHADVAVGGVSTFECTPDIVNTVVWHNTSPLGIQADGACLDWSFSNVGGFFCAGQDGNIDADPRFVNIDPAAGKIDLSLQPGSPSIDAGNDDFAPFTDLLGTERHDDVETDNCDPAGDPGAPECAWISDQGAYEYTGL